MSGTVSDEVKEFQAYLAEQPKGSDIYELVMYDMAGASREENPNVAMFSVDSTVGLLALFFGPLLYRWAIDTLDARRNSQELNAAEERIKLMLHLETEYGYPHDVAEETVTRGLDAIAKRSKDDKTLQKIAGYVSGLVAKHLSS